MSEEKSACAEGCACNGEQQKPQNPFERLADATAHVDLVQQDLASLDEMLSVAMSDLNHKRHERKLAIEEFKAALNAYLDSVSPAFLGRA